MATAVCCLLFASVWDVVFAFGCLLCLIMLVWSFTYLRLVVVCLCVVVF